jgi:MFS family permease
VLIEHPLHLMHVDEPQSDTPNAKRWVALTFICMIIPISTLDMTTLNTALSALTRELGTTTAQLQWIVASYAIMLAGLLALAAIVVVLCGMRTPVEAPVTSKVAAIDPRASQA